MKHCCKCDEEFSTPGIQCEKCRGWTTRKVDKQPQSLPLAVTLSISGRDKLPFYKRRGK
jgi:hypothetical protein